MVTWSLAVPKTRIFVRCVYYGTAKGKIIAGFVSTDNLVPLAEDQELTQDFLVGTWEKTK
jgi:hypothetical protein